MFNLTLLLLLLHLILPVLPHQLEEGSSLAIYRTGNKPGELPHRMIKGKKSIYSAVVDASDDTFIPAIYPACAHTIGGSLKLAISH